MFSDDDVNKVHVRLYEPPEGEEEVQLFDISQPPSKGPLNGWARRYDLLPHELIVNAAKTKALGGQCFKQAGQQTVKTTKVKASMQGNLLIPDTQQTNTPSYASRQPSTSVPTHTTRTPWEH